MADRPISETQRAILAFLAEGHAPYLAFYHGPPGAEGGPQAGFFWRQYDRTQKAPRVPANAVNGLLKRGLLQAESDNDCGITKEGRERHARKVGTT